MSDGSRVRLAAALAFATLCAATAARAQEPATQRVSLQGFGGWAYGKTDNDNGFAYSADGKGVWNNYYFALNVAAQPMEKLSIRAQAFWGEDLRPQRTNLDYAFAEWAESSSLKLRVGKVLAPFGLYSETYDVGTLRPFYLLPQFYAGTLGLIPKSYLGGGVTGTARLSDSWDLQYDAFGGEVQFDPFPIERVVGVDPGTGLPQVQTSQTQITGRQMVGGRLLLASPLKGFDVGGTVIHIGQLDYPPDSPLSMTHATLVNGRIQYQRAGFAARGEYFGVLTDDADMRSWYAEASYKLTRHWQLAAQYEKSKIVLAAGDTSIPDTLLNHSSFGLGLNFWVSPEFVLKLNGYAVDKNMIARPANAGLRAALGTIDTSTGVVVAGAQFSF
jgi:hypothetical protein